MTFDQIMAKGINDFDCPRCKAAAGTPCRTPKGDPSNGPHKGRVVTYWAAAADAAKRERTTA